jgi:hypothetical protein
MDGNGPMAQFLVNTMMAAGGYPWTVIPLPERKAYMSSLEKASVGGDIGPFADFAALLVGKRLAGGPLPDVKVGWGKWDRISAGPWKEFESKGDS